MVHLIDKSALVAEIEKWRDGIKKGIFSIPLTGSDKACATFEYEILGKIKDFLDTLEVKEVDLKKETDKWYNNEASKEFENVLYKDIEKCAKHFFELGLNTGNPLTWEDIKTIQDKLGEVYAEVAKGKDDFYSIYPTEQSFLEEVLKRFKAQKGE